MTTIAAILFWLSAVLLVYTHLGYPLLVMLLTRIKNRNRDPRFRKPTLYGGSGSDVLPTVSLIVPAYDEEEVVAA